MTVYDINPKSTALLIIDAQNEYFLQSGALFTPNAEGIRSRLISLRKAAHEAGMMCVIVQHVHRASGIDVGRMGDFDPTECFTEGSSGAALIDSLNDKSTDVVVKKSRYSAFVNTELESILRGNGVDTIIVSGLMTQYCCVTTARHAHDLDYRVIFVKDANAGPDIPDMGHGDVSHGVALQVIVSMLAMGVADIQSTEQIVAALSSHAENQELHDAHADISDHSAPSEG
jgi:biuret amidohydrolase